MSSQSGTSGSDDADTASGVTVRNQEINVVEDESVEGHLPREGEAEGSSGSDAVDYQADNEGWNFDDEESIDGSLPRRQLQYFSSDKKKKITIRYQKR